MIVEIKFNNLLDKCLGLSECSIFLFSNINLLSKFKEEMILLELESDDCKMEIELIGDEKLEIESFHKVDTSEFLINKNQRLIMTVNPEILLTDFDEEDITIRFITNTDVSIITWCLEDFEEPNGIEPYDLKHVYYGLVNGIYGWIQEE